MKTLFEKNFLEYNYDDNLKNTTCKCTQITKKYLSYVIKFTNKLLNRKPLIIKMAIYYVKTVTIYFIYQHSISTA